MTSFADLEKCIQANISAPNNDIRTQAEKHLKELKQKHAQQFFEGLCSLIKQSKDSNVRSFSAVLLKQNLSIFDETFFKIAQNSQNNIKQSLLECISSEANPNVLTQVAEAVSKLMCLIIQNSNNNNNKWKEVMPFLFTQLSKNSHTSKRVAFYICIEKLACNCVDILRVNSMLPQLRDIIVIGLNDAEMIVREYALGAIIALLCSLNEENELLFFSNIVPLLFKNISTANGGNNDEIICKTCETLTILAENQPNFFMNSMAPIIECLVNVTKCNTLQWETRRLSMNLLVTLLDFYAVNNIGRNLQKLLEIGNKVIPLVFDFLHAFDDSLEWNAPSDDCEQSNFVFGQEILPNIVLIFTPEIFLNIIQKPIFDVGFSDNSQWKKKVIALKTIEITAEGCVEHYEHKLQYIIDGIMKCIKENNSNKYVKYVCLSLIKQLSVIFGEDKEIFLTPFHTKIMSVMCKILCEAPQNEHRCVLIAVCEAIAHFAYADDCEDEDSSDSLIFLQYSNTVLNGLFTLVTNSSDKLIIIHSLKAMSVTISVVQDRGFNKQFYANFMKYCITLLRDIFGNSHNCKFEDKSGELRGRCMECIGQMLVVVDIDTCRADAHNIMKFLLQYQAQEQSNQSSESYTYMLALFAACAEALTHEFSVYLEHVIPPLIKSANKQSISMKRRCANTNSDDDYKENNANNSNVIMEEFGGIRFQVNTAEFNERSTAVKQFPRYAVCMEGHLLPFVKPISSVLKPIIKSRALSSVARRHAIETFFPLVNCLKLGLIGKNLSESEVSKWVTEFTMDLLQTLIESLSMSDEVDEFSLICKALSSLIVTYIDCALFTNSQIISDITEQISVALNEREQRRVLNEEKSIDLIDEEVEFDVEADLADTVTDLVSNLVQKFGDKYCDMFDKHCGQKCIDLLNANANNENDMILGLSILTEMVRYSPTKANKYIKYVLSVSQKILSNDPNTNASEPLLQSIAYAIGIIANKKELNHFGQLTNWLTLLNDKIIANPAVNDPSATENAISAMGKICANYEAEINNKFIMDWIQLLPLLFDNEEREEFANNYLLRILKKTSLLKGVIESKNVKIIQKIIHCAAVAIYNNDSQSTEFKQLFAHIKGKVNDGIVSQAINGLSSELQTVFN